MPRSFFKPSTAQVKTALIVTLAIGLAAASIEGARAFVSSRAGDSLPAPSSNATAPAPVTEQDSVEADEAEIVTARPSGFEPNEVRRPGGKFQLVVYNRSGLEQLRWRLDRKAGGRLHDVQLSEGRLRSGLFINLPPGEYELSESDHPGWLCRITVEPR